MKQTLYIVTGMHRSGTSAVARMLQVFGIGLPGDLKGPAADNERGFFEDKTIVDLNNEILKTLELNWDSLDGFFLSEMHFSGHAFNPLRRRARDLLSKRLIDQEDWAFKDPRLCRLMNFWLPLIQELNISYKLVMAVRRPIEVANSLASRNDFDRLKTNYLWVLHNLSLLTATQDIPRICLDYNDLLDDPKQVIDGLVSFLPRVKEKEKASFIDEFLTKELNHHQEPKEIKTLELAEKLYQQISSGNVDKKSIDPWVTELFERQDLLDLFTLISTQENKNSKHLRDETDKLTAVIARQSKDLNVAKNYQDKIESDLSDFKDYQQKIEAELEEQKVWSDKLREDISAMERNLISSEEAKNTLDSKVEILENAHATALVQVEERDNDIEKLQNDLSEERLALANERLASNHESQRLWEIIEKYRLNLVAIETSVSWRMTAPLRSSINFFRKTIFQTKSYIRAFFRGLIFRLPPENIIRQTILRRVERFNALIRGDLDSQSIRASHRQLIKERDILLGEKKLLEDKQLPLIDISIVSYNSSEWVEPFYMSLVTQDYPKDKLNITFVDNDSKDDTIEALDRLDWSKFNSMTCINNDNVGFGGGHHLGIQKGTAEYILVTNIDLEFRKDSLRRVVSFAVNDSADVACWELRQSPYEHPKFYDPVTLQTAWSAHACILMRRKIYQQSGGYEERIFMYGEDVELSYRYRSLGYKLRYMPSAVVDHYSYKTAGEVKPLQYQGSTLANAYLRLRYGTMFDVLSIIPLYIRLLTGSGGVTAHRKLIWQNVAKIILNARHFLRKRPAMNSFSFRNWDYEIVRDGAFYVSQPLSNEIPLVSVITRTYAGRETLLKQCMQSVANQTYTNLEHIIVEDGGDSMKTTIESFQRAYPSSKIRHLPQAKLGRCAAGNQGLAQASGQYMVFLDDDDLFFSDHLEVCIGELLSDSSLNAVYCLAWEVETEFTEHGYEERSHSTPPIMHQNFDRDILLHHNYIPIQSIVFQRALFEKHGGFDIELENLEDWNLWVRYAASGNFKLIKKTTTMYRTPWDIMEKARRQSVLDDYLDFARRKNRGQQT